MPWHTIDIQDNSECIRVEDLQFIVDAILEEIENREKVTYQKFLMSFKLTVTLKFLPVFFTH